jgi:hypothetical protein
MIRKKAAAAAACFVSLSAHAIDGVSVETGRGDDKTSVLRVAVTEDWRKAPPLTDDWRLAGYWELSAAVWDNPQDSTADIGLTPVFRFMRGRRRKGSVYVEAAIGFHLVQTHISASRVFSTAFQFGDHVGAGMHLGPDGRYDLGVRLQHISNGRIATPNPGINFWLVRLQYSLE